MIATTSEPSPQTNGPAAAFGAAFASRNPRADARNSSSMEGILGPESLSWQLFADYRVALVAGRTLVLQVAHPVVGAGVSDYSTFQAEPWRRLWGTFQSVSRLIYLSEARAAEEGARLRKLHRAFTGVTANGEPYRALDPDAYLWVYATLWDGAITMRARFGRPLMFDEQQRFFEEWREVGRRLGI